MKQTIKTTILLGVFSMMSFVLNAQEIKSTNMLEMAPYRHYINPAYEPLTNGYFYLPAISRFSLGIGNNSLAMQDLIINQNGKTMWTINPESEKSLFGAFKKNTLVRAQASTAILGFGFRVKEKSYIHVNIDANLDAGINTPRGLFDFALNGGMQDLTGMNSYDLQSLGMQAQAYLSVGLGYSRKIGEHLVVGAKLKFLDGIAYAGVSHKDLQLNASPEQWTLNGSGEMAIAAPFSQSLQHPYPNSAEVKDLQEWAHQDNPLFDAKDIANLLKPSGLGAAVDLGVTYQPLKMLKVSLALTDLGGIHWTRGVRMGYDVNGNFDGLGTINYSDFQDEDGKFDSNRLSDTLTSRLSTVYENALVSNGPAQEGFNSMLNMKLNAGVDAYFLNHIIGVGLYSQTMLYNQKMYEELTIGASVRPFNWLNFALSYSMMNGRWDNVGAALGLRGGPLAITLAADYVPLTYAHINAENGKDIALPYKMQGLNLELGISIVWGWKDKAKAEARKAKKAAEDGTTTITTTTTVVTK